VSVQVPIQNRKCSARMITEHGRIKCETREDNGEQSDGGQAKSGVWHAVKEPAERRAFERPGHCDPLSIKLDRENQGDEKECGAAEERELGIACQAGCWCAFEQSEKSKQRWQCKCRRH